MRIGMPSEIKDQECRVAMTPEGVRTLVQAGHEVAVEQGAGEKSAFADASYRAAGAELTDAASAWQSELVLKVKEPQPSEFEHLDGQTVFTYFHLAGVEPGLTDALLTAGVTAVAYETVEDDQGRLPLLEPMSAVAGHMAATIGSYYLARFNGGRGVLLSSLLGEEYGKVLVIGDGVVGRHAARAAAALGAQVTICGLDPERAEALRNDISPQLEFLQSNRANIAEALTSTDLVVGAVLLPGARAPRLVDEDMVASMPNGSVIIDVSIDQGGCIATSRPTSHSDPVYVVHGVTHYCVTNMPGAYPRTSTLALSAATLPYAQRLADNGFDALRRDAGFARGLNTHAGKITCAPVAEAMDRMSDYEAFA